MFATVVVTKLMPTIWSVPLARPTTVDGCSTPPKAQPAAPPDLYSLEVGLDTYRQHSIEIEVAEDG